MPTHYYRLFLIDDARFHKEPDFFVVESKLDHDEMRKLVSESENRGDVFCFVRVDHRGPGLPKEVVWNRTATWLSFDAILRFDEYHFPSNRHSTTTQGDNSRWLEERPERRHPDGGAYRKP